MAPSESEPRRPLYQVLLDACVWIRDVYEAAPTPAHHLRLEAGARQLRFHLYRPGRFAPGQLVRTPGANDHPTAPPPASVGISPTSQARGLGRFAMGGSPRQRAGTARRQLHVLFLPDLHWGQDLGDHRVGSLRHNTAASRGVLIRLPAHHIQVRWLAIALHSCAGAPPTPRKHPQPKVQFSDRSNERSFVRPESRSSTTETYPKVLFLNVPLTTHFPT